MPVQTDTTLKTYFETGDIPTEAQFIDLIDSKQTVLTLSSQFAGVTDATGSGSLVLATSPTLTTPVINQINTSGTSLTIYQSGSNRAIIGNGSPTFTAYVGFTSFNPASPDASINRASAGVLQVGTTVSNALGTLNLANLNASAVINAGTYTVATLPSAASNTYKIANVSDLDTGTAVGSVAVGSGTKKAAVWCDGTSWYVTARQA